MLLSRAKRVIEGPLNVNHQRVIERLYFFLEDVFFFNFRGFQTSSPLLMRFCGECQKSDLEIRSSYGSRDNFFDFGGTSSILIQDFQKKSFRIFWGLIFDFDPNFVLM